MYVGVPPCTVIKFNGEPLEPRLDLANKSPARLCLGLSRKRSGAARVAILADYLRDDNTALAHYQAFKEKVIGKLPQG